MAGKNPAVFGRCAVLVLAEASRYTAVTVSQRVIFVHPAPKAASPAPVLT
jgi:hypothetical protein